ncbi:unnamed protein product [Sphagnum tenellum]
MTIKEPWRTLTRLMFLNQTMHSLCVRRGEVKRMLDDFQGALEDLDKADVLKPNDAFTLRARGEVKRMLDDYQGALEDLDKADVLEPNNAVTLRRRGEVKRMLDDFEGALEDLDKADVLKPNNAFTLRARGEVKRMLDDYQGALEDLDKADVLEPNNAFTVRVRGEVKRMLDDYQRALEDLDKVNVLEPNDAFTLKARGKVKKMLHNYQGALEDLDKVDSDVLQPNDAFILTTYAHRNWSLNKYQAAVETIDKLHFLERNDDFISQTRKWLKWMLDEYQPIIKSLPFNSSIQPFTYNELNFGLSLGKGAYGEVYQSCWKGIPIAIKILEWSGDHNEGAKKSFISEVNTLGSIQHINLVRLLGYCIEGLKHMLVYEYISNSSLDKWLDGDNRLDWDKRICIIIGVTQGLAHLHHKCDPPIVHLDIKLGNILLDKDYTPKLSDFGLAKKLHGMDENVIALASTSRPGTSGYMAPKICSNQASTKSDVYSFGVLLIQLVNGSPLTLDGDEILIRHFIQWVQKVHGEEDGFQQIFDVAINNSIVGFDPNEAKLILQISLQCIKKDPNQRPEMQEFLQRLEGLNKKKGLQYIVSLIQESFNTLSKRIWVS